MIPITRFVRSFRLASWSAAWRRAGDWLGTLVLAVCMLHGLLIPLVLAALPLDALAGEARGAFHPLLALVLFPITAAALWGGPDQAGCTHDPGTKRGLLMAGLLLVWVARPARLWLGPVAEALAIFSGSLCLIAGHQYGMLHPDEDPAIDTH